MGLFPDQSVTRTAGARSFSLRASMAPGLASPSFIPMGRSRPILLAALACLAAHLIPGLHAQETITVNVTQPRQEIYGFGAGMKRQTSNLRDMPEPARTEVLNLMFRDVNTRILRTYLRHNHETTNDNSDPAVLNPGALTWGAYSDDIWVYQQALAIAGGRLDTLYASCNTAPAWMKGNNNIVGGSLTANNTTYNEFGEQIWGYIRHMKLTHGMDIRAVSIFNEPGYEVTHDSMNPSTTQAANILAVVGPYLNARFAENPSFTPALLVAPDGHNTSSSISYLNATLANSGASAAADIVGSHYYGGSASDWATMASLAGNRMLWQTEYATLSGASDDISEGLDIAGRIHDVLAAGGHAYVAFQWVVETDSPGTGNGLIRLLTDGTYVVPKRYHIFKQWANSVPPGSVRLTTSTTTTGLKITAYRTPDNRTVVLQVINDGAGNKTGVVFNVPGASGAVQRTRTSSTLDASGLPSITATNGTFTNDVFTNTMTTYLVPVHASHLTGLTLSSGALSPAFAGGTFAYTANVSAPSITVTPTLAGATITVNGSAVASGTASAPIPLTFGENTITVASTAAGSTSTYTLTVTRTLNSYTWAINQAGPSSWNTSANWTPNTGVPNGIDGLANLTNNITTHNVISLASPVTIGGLAIGDASGNNAFTIAAGHPITFDVSSGSATLTRSATGNSNDIINAALILADPLTASVTNATGSLALNGAISETGGAQSLSKTGAGTLILSGLGATAAGNYSGATIIDKGTLRITTTNPSLTGNLTFGSIAGGTNAGHLDLSAASATFAGAFQARTDSTHAITIGSGRTLQLNGAFTVGYNTTALPHSTTGLGVSGSGTLSIGTPGTPTNANVQIGNGATSGVGNAGILDMSGLASFHANLGTGAFRVGSPTNGNSANGGGSTVVLAANSTIQAATLLLGSPDGAVNGGDTAIQSLKLGSGANVINVDTMNLGGIGTADGRSNGSLTFDGVDGTLKIRSQTDPVNGRPNLNIGVVDQNTGAVQLDNLFDTSGHTADLRFNSMRLGFRTRGAGSTTARFIFDDGMLDANSLTAGSRGGSAEAAATATGIVTFGGGTVTINNTSNPIQLGVNALGSGTAAGTLNISGGSVTVAASGGNSIRLGNASVALGSASGTLNLTGGTLTVAGDIIRGATTGTSNATVNLGGGTLDMNGQDLGATGSGTVAFNVESGVLQNVASINGSDGLTKTTTGTLVLQGNNTYSGGTTIDGGMIALGSSNTIPSTPLAIGTATLDAASFSDTVGTLDVTGTAVINLGSGASLAFADSSSIDWTGGTLTITGNFVSGSSLRFGTSASALDAAQLAKISGGGFLSYSLNSSGYLVGIGATFESWQTANNTTGAFDSDHDNDGVPDGIEYFIGGNSNTTGHTPMPGVENGIGALSVTWTRSSNYPGIYGTHFRVESSDTLTGTWTPETVGGNVTVTGNNITYTFPSGGARRFVRLKVIGP